MKTHLNHSRPLRGSTLVVLLIVTGLVGLTLIAYLSLVKTQSFSTARSQAWNMAMPVIEAGVEDALTHLNVNGTNNLLACCGWYQSGSLYWTRRYLGGRDAYYVVTISNWVAGMSNNSQPIIDSRAFIDVSSFAAAQPDWMLAQAGTTSITRSQLARAVRVQARPRRLFMKGMVAKGAITFTGNALVDSFNSEDPTKSTDGRYDPAKHQDHGDVASNQQIVNAITAGSNTKIYGKISTGPGGTSGFTDPAVAGSMAWVDGGNTGVEPGYFVDDMNVNFSDVGVPFTGGYYSPAAGDYQGTNYTYLLDSRRYQAGTITMSSANTMMVVGNAELYVTGNLTLSGQSRIIIAPGASLKLYVGGTADFTGQGIFNQTGYAINCFIYGLPGCSRVKFTGNSEFIGVVYAPSAELKLGGGGSDVLDFKGASITASVYSAGKLQFHYDESLANKGPVKGYFITSWNEMTPQQAAALPLGIAKELSFNYQ